MSLEIVIGLQIFVANFADEGFRRISSKRGDVGFRFNERRGRRRRAGVAGGRRQGRGATILTRIAGMHDGRHHGLTVIGDFRLYFRRGATRTGSGGGDGGGGCGGVDADGG